jgi:hypothetical protein
MALLCIGFAYGKSHFFYPQNQKEPARVSFFYLPENKKYLFSRWPRCQSNSVEHSLIIENLIIPRPFVASSHHKNNQKHPIKQIK